MSKEKSIYIESAVIITLYYLYYVIVANSKECVPLNILLGTLAHPFCDD